MVSREKRLEWRGTALAAALGAALVGALSAIVVLIKSRTAPFAPNPNPFGVQYITAPTNALTDIVPILATIIATLVVSITGIGTLARQDRLRNLSDTSDNIRARIERISSNIGRTNTETTPFEIEQLSGYYSLTLGQARISFWFSLIFAAIGFLIIVGGAALYTEGGMAAATIKIVSGVVVDAVSALFFIQSRRAQDSMSAFFEKLRSDRQFAEARKICDELFDSGIKDHLKTILVLHYSGLEAKPMIDALAPRMAQGVVHNS